jgi:mono/diheme cytochrome c family protein
LRQCASFWARLDWRSHAAVRDKMREMHGNKTLLRIFGVAALAVPAVFAQQSGGDATKGKELFLKYSCYACHGFSGQNGSGARLVPMRMTTAAFTAYVRSPRTRQMPSFSTKVLSDEQLADIHAYIKTLPASKPAKDIPALEQFKQK